MNESVSANGLLASSRRVFQLNVFQIAELAEDVCRRLWFNPLLDVTLPTEPPGYPTPRGPLSHSSRFT